jgi:arsenite/tail-anchored protein-transporting ATPase
VIDVLSKRIVLVTGKGGVGRTTLSAAIATAGAQQGKQVLIAEIGDPSIEYSPLAHLFGRSQLPTEPTVCAERISCCLLWSRQGQQMFLNTVLPVPALVKAAVKSKALGRLLDAAPSFNEMGVFYHLLSLVKEKRNNGAPRYDLIVVDMPATGHTLALTQLPEHLLRLMPTGPIAEAMKEGQHYLYNSKISGAFVVCLPETLPVTESLELIEGLKETSIHVGGVLVNKVTTDDFSTEEHQALAPLLNSHILFGASRYQAMRNSQAEINRIRKLAGVPIHLVPELPLQGEDLLQGLATGLKPRGNS